MNQISENLFSAIDIIIQERLKNLSYDKTLLCTIVNDSNKYSGKYSVTYQNLTFEAYSENNSYKINDQVYVIFPENDDSKQRIIIGKYIATKNSYATLHYEDSLVIYGKLIADKNNVFDVKNISNIPSKVIVKGNFTSLNSNNRKLNITLKYSDGSYEYLSFTSHEIVGQINDLRNSPQEAIFNLINYRNKTLESIDVKINGFIVTNLSLIFGESIENSITQNKQEDLILLNSLNDLNYSSSQEKIIYATVLHQNNQGIYVKQKDENILWQKYLITGYTDTSINAAWSNLSSSTQDYYSFTTDLKYPYERFRAISLNTASDIVTFNNETWEGEDVFDAIVSSSDFYLSIEVKPANEDNAVINVITSGDLSVYKIKCGLYDSYDNTLITNNLDNISLFWVPESFNNVGEINNFSFDANIAENEASYGILCGIAQHEGVRYVSYCAVGWRKDSSYTSFIGPKVITYNDLGSEPIFNHSPYSIGEADLIWETNKVNQTGYPTITYNEAMGTYTLTPLNTYLYNLPNDFRVIAKNIDDVIWIQPVVIMQTKTLEANVELNSTLLSQTVMSLGRLDGDKISGIFIGTEKVANGQSNPGVFGFIKDSQSFKITDDKILLGQYQGIRSNDLTNDKSYVQFSYEPNGSNEIVSRGRAAAQEVQDQTEEELRSAAGFKIDLTNDKIDSTYFTLGNKDETQFGGCRIGELENGEKGMLVKPKNILEKVLTGQESNIDDSWLITYKYIKTLEERIAALENSN